MTAETLKGLDKDQLEIEVFSATPLGTNEEIMTAMSKIVTLEKPSEEDFGWKAGFGRHC